MSLSFAIMIEGQEGLTWDRWERLARLAEDEGYESLFRSDHVTGLADDPTRPSLDTWASLAWLATATRRIRFGSLVCPMTFYHPAILAKRAAAVSQLSGGRFELGLGAGWNEGEHRMFGIPFPPLKERLERLECGTRVIRALEQGGPVTLAQPYYPLVDAQTTPLPVGGRLPLIIGARGERRALRNVAAHADEWNITRITPEDYPAKHAVLAEHCRAVGRDPAQIRRSVMLPIVVGRTPEEVAARHRRATTLFNRVPADPAAWGAAGFLHGLVKEVRDALARWQAVGVQRLMLQMLDMDDLDHMRLIARELIPAFR